MPRLEQTPLLSVIVPVYRGAAYLEACAASVLSQQLPDGGVLELLLIDDGSTDGSAAVCDALAARDARVRVWHRPNAGVCAARNAGMEKARGEYLTFADEDDTVAPGSYFAALDRAREIDADAVLFSIRYVICTGTAQETPPLFAAQTPAQLAPYFLQMAIGCSLWGAAWNKLYRTAVLRAGGVRFPQGAPVNEDELFVFAVLRAARRWASVPEAVYLYNQCNAGSVTARGRENLVACAQENLPAFLEAMRAAGLGALCGVYAQKRIGVAAQNQFSAYLSSYTTFPRAQRRRGLRALLAEKAHREAVLAQLSTQKDAASRLLYALVRLRACGVLAALPVWKAKLRGTPVSESVPAAVQNTAASEQAGAAAQTAAALPNAPAAVPAAANPENVPAAAQNENTASAQNSAQGEKEEHR